MKLPSLFGALRDRRSHAAAGIVRALPSYQVALWPDGWELGGDGTVAVRDTHGMAEARRWYAAAARNCENRRHSDTDRVMRVHGIFVPRPIVDLAGRCFPSEQVASVALHLIAGDWIEARRRQLLAAPERALGERRLAWCGSRHAGTPEAGELHALMARLLQDCIAERLLPQTDYGLDLHADDGYGIRMWRCLVQVELSTSARARTAEALNAALIPWNRVVIRDGCAVPLIGLRVEAPRRARI